MAESIAKGDVRRLLMPNRPEYLAIWLGLTRIGGVVALINTNLSGEALGHCITVAAPTHIIVAPAGSPMRWARPSAMVWWQARPFA